jgi:hypothetical protein
MRGGGLSIVKERLLKTGGRLNHRPIMAQQWLEEVVA